MEGESTSIGHQFKSHSRMLDGHFHNNLLQKLFASKRLKVNKKRPKMAHLKTGWPLVTYVGSICYNAFRKKYENGRSNRYHRSNKTGFIQPLCHIHRMKCRIMYVPWMAIPIKNTSSLHDYPTFGNLKDEAFLVKKLLFKLK